jgi:hypothetical protein
MATLDHVEAELAERIRGMQTDAGNQGLVLVVTTGYRDLDDQWRLYNDMVEAKEKYGKKWQKYAALAAYPGTSDHGRNPATAVDLACAAPTKENIAKHGSLATRWGLARTVASEYWHLQLARSRASIPAGAPTPEDDDMPFPHSCAMPSGRGWWQLNPDGSVETHVFKQGDILPFHGSLYDYPQERTKINERTGKPRVWTTIQAVGPRDEDGYFVFADDGFCGKLVKK